jgi:hypothetical protein
MTILKKWSVRLEIRGDMVYNHVGVVNTSTIGGAILAHHHPATIVRSVLSQNLTHMTNIKISSSTTYDTMTF